MFGTLVAGSNCSALDAVLARRIFVLQDLPAGQWKSQTGFAGMSQRIIAWQNKLHGVNLKI
jgi:hypothetical protein